MPGGRPKNKPPPILASGRQWIDVLASKFSRKQKLYAQYLAFADDTDKLAKLGLPITKDDFYKFIGELQPTCWRWERGGSRYTKEDFWDLVNLYAREGSREYLAAAYTTIGKAAANGNLRAAMVLQEILGRQDEQLAKIARKSPGAMAPALNEVGEDEEVGDGEAGTQNP